MTPSFALHAKELASVDYEEHKRSLRTGRHMAEKAVPLLRLNPCHFIKMFWDSREEISLSRKREGKHEKKMKKNMKKACFQLAFSLLWACCSLAFSTLQPRSHSLSAHESATTVEGQVRLARSHGQGRQLLLLSVFKEDLHCEDLKAAGNV